MTMYQTTLVSKINDAIRIYDITGPAEIIRDDYRDWLIRQPLIPVAHAIYGSGIIEIGANTGAIYESMLDGADLITVSVHGVPMVTMRRVGHRPKIKRIDWQDQPSRIEWHDQDQAFEQTLDRLYSNRPGKLIGQSLSFCISDMISGKVGYDQVDKIMAGTCFRNEQELEGVIRHYQQLYWRGDPDRAAEIVRRLYREGRIEQPRLAGKDAPYPHPRWLKA